MNPKPMPQPEPPSGLVDALGDIVPDGAVWTGLKGGRSNRTWRVTGSSCNDTANALVVKLFRPRGANPLFPNDPDCEAALMTALSPHALAPKFVAQVRSVEGIANIYYHVDGPMWADDVASVAHLMRRLHGIEYTGPLRGAPNGAREIKEQADRILALCHARPELPQIPTPHTAPANKTVLLHGDMVPGNLVRSRDGLVLIDWQCPATGDPCEDIAVFLSPAMHLLYGAAPLDDIQQRAFFDAYGDADIKARYHALAPFYHRRMAAYCQWQAENGRADYAHGVALERAALQRSLSQYQK